MNDSSRPANAGAVLVVGAGDATGGAIARRFAREGLIACVSRRNVDKLAPLVERIRGEGGQARAFGSDARVDAEMVSLVETIEREVAPIEVAVFNIGANVRFAVTDTTERVYRKVWEMGALAGVMHARPTMAFSTRSTSPKTTGNCTASRAARGPTSSTCGHGPRPGERGAADMTDNADNADKSIEFFFDFGSPTTYLAFTQLPRIARETGARLIYRPMLLGAVFKATGNASPVSVAAKARWMASDLASWAAHYGVPFSFNPFFPINTLNLMRAAAGMQMEQAEDFDRFVDVVFRAMWIEGRNLGDAEVFANLLREAAFEPSVVLDLIASPDVKARLIAHTEEAVSRGVFGAPTIFVGEKMFFGQDRLHFVADALQRG